MPRERLPLVQVLRAVAALLVAVQHAQADAATLAERFGGAFRPSTLLPWNAGVDVFFVISGFIIVHAAAPLFGRAGARRTFLAHRAARVVPLYWIVTTLYLGIALAAPAALSGGAPLVPGYVLASYLFVPVSRPDGYVQPLYSLGWTLNYEAFFYVLFALCLGLRRRAAVAAACAALLLLPLAGRLLAPLPEPLAFWTQPILIEFALGALLGLARAEGLRLPAGACLGLASAGIALLVLAPEPGAARALLWGGPAALLVAAAILAPSSIPLAPSFRVREAEAEIHDHPLQPVMSSGFSTSRSVGTRDVLLRAGIALGDASYALYLFHPFAIRALREAFFRARVDPGPALFVVLALATAIAASLVIHRLVERPLTRGVRAALEPRAAAELRR